MLSMTLRFSEEGPTFPTELVRALSEGDVVFLCGAGVSAPQLPGFAGLVDGCFEALGEEKTPAERVSYDERRFEETLGTLGRRLVDPEELTDVVCRALQAPADADLAHHRTVLRLSRDRDGRASVVTTNFDTLIERALQPSDAPGGVRAESFAGQALPQPGGARFGGVVHLHGRVEDEALGLERTELVVTSADYGDAYMRSGWASRFLFDLARCKTIVLIGYSAGDAPVRYFLNVLEADRGRFGDLRKVYALDAAAPGAEPDPRWTAVAVEPLAYVAPAAAGRPDHGALWRDLESLAELVERPRATRRAAAGAALRRNLADLTQLERERTLWLFESDESGGLWDIPSRLVEDPAWFDALHGGGLISADRAWVLAAWCARDFADEGRFRFAVAWCARLGGRLAAELRRRFVMDVCPPSALTTAWRVLTAPEAWHQVDVIEGPFVVTRALAGPEVLHEDLRRAVRLLTPVIKVSPRGVRTDAMSPPGYAVDLVRMHLTVPELGGGMLGGLSDALAAVTRVEAVTALATEALRAVLEEAVDVGLIVGDDDGTDFSVPSVEDHPQNEHRDGTVFLVTLLSRLLPTLAARDREAARCYAERWKALPGRTGRRLWLHALRFDVVFSADEAIDGVLRLGPREFWSGSREMPLVLRERAREAARPLLDDIERRIIAEAPAYYAGFERGSGEVDWREHAADRVVWFRLRMLEEAGALSSAGSLALREILERRAYLVRELEDRDFFGSYIFPVETVVGDASPIVEAGPDDRLHVARTIAVGPSFEQQQGWSAYCRSEPRAALETLGAGAFEVDDAGLWRDLLSTVAYLSEDRADERAALAVAVFEALAPAEDAFVTEIVAPLVDVYQIHPRSAERSLPGWWQRLFHCALTYESRNLPAGDRREEWSLTPSSRLTRAALIDVNRHVRIVEPVPQADLDSLESASTAGERGFHSLAALAYDAAFVLSVEGHGVAERLVEALAGDDADAHDLRFVLVTNPRTTPALSTVFRAQVLRGVAEFTTPTLRSRAVAAKILAPAIAAVREEWGRPDWGIDLADARRALREGSPALREGAAGCLADWCAGEADKAAYWRETVAPLLAAVWPRDKQLKAPGQCLHLVRLAVQAGDAFPRALATVRSHLTVAAGILHLVRASAIPEDWPRETLDLLWTTRERAPGTGYYNLAEILDRLRAADPTLEPDRRFQRLELLAPRFC